MATVAVFLYNTQYISKERGFRLTNYRDASLTWNAWSYGKWKTTRNGPVTIDTYEPPYTLLVAITPQDSASATVEILNASIVQRDGNRTPIDSTLASPLDDVILRPHALVRQPYAVFRFDDLLPAHETVTLEVVLRIRAPQRDETLTQRITIPAYETERHSFTFVEALMGI
jgi:hypothetical protein